MVGSDGWIALVSAFLSGVVVKIVDHTYARGDRRFDDAVAIRHELRDEVKALHENMTALQEDLDRWRDRYYDLATRYQTLAVECQSLRAELQELQAHDDLRAYQQFQRVLAEMRDAAPADPGKVFSKIVQNPPEQNPP